jgi:hypothetical protein
MQILSLTNSKVNEIKTGKRYLTLLKKEASNKEIIIY